MPGPVSDAYDPEWGTAAKADDIARSLRVMHTLVSGVLGNKPPLYILDLIRADLPTRITATFSERQWRLIRFALERAGESL